MANTDVDAKLVAVGPYNEVMKDHDGPASYPTGGEVITAISLGLKQIFSVVASGSDNGAQFTCVRFATKKGVTSFKLLWFVNTTGAEVANAVDLSARFCRLLVKGI
jgi:hypothetical protein